MFPNTDITALLLASQSGDEAALEELLRAVYPALRNLAAQEMRRECGGHTLQPTALVNEVFLKLFHGSKVEWENRGHFFRLAARQMRNILTSYARKRLSAKRGGGLERTPLFDDVAIDPVSVEEMVAMDAALERLGELDARVAEVVELRVFGGLSEEETAAVMEVSVTTVGREWRFGRTWLFDQLRPPARR